MKDTGVNKNSKVKIYEKYYNSMRTLRACGLVPAVKKLSVKTSLKHLILNSFFSN